MGNSQLSTLENGSFILESKTTIRYGHDCVQLWPVSPVLIELLILLVLVWLCWYCCSPHQYHMLITKHSEAVRCWVVLFWVQILSPWKKKYNYSLQILRSLVFNSCRFIIFFFEILVLNLKTITVVSVSKGISFIFILQKHG